MSQFRIKHIDEGVKDEWVFRLNEDGIQLGDDIDARDPNELAEAIIDIQEVLLKTSSLAAAAILKPNSGLAERLTILEATAGEATLQDIYENGNYISILSGRPLVLGAREEIKIDDAGNLSFKPVTMRVKGSGTAYLELSNQALFTSLGDLLVGAVSPGNNLFLRAGGNVSLQDNYLTNPVTLSQSGDSQLDTVSQSLVGAINELKSSTFNVSLQSVYTQSTPPKVTTNISSGPIIIEDGNAASLGDTFKVIGNSTVTKKSTMGSAKVGNNTTIADITGIVTSERIKTTSELQAIKLNSELNELTFQDKRISVPLSQTSHNALTTNNPSIIGAINELKSNIDSVGGAVTSYDQEHVAATGEHGIITTQAAIGQNTAKRFIVKNQSGIEKYSITGDGNVIANAMVLSGLDVVSLLNLLNAHLVDDGTSHTALANHLVASNPHNTVRRLATLSGDITFGSPDGSVGVSTSGNTINLTAIDQSDLQSVYTKSLIKSMTLGLTGLTFKNPSLQDVLVIEPGQISPKAKINFTNIGAEVHSDVELMVRSVGDLRIISESEDVELSTLPAKSIYLQGIKFDEPAVKVLPRLEGDSVLSNLKKLDEDKSIEMPLTIAIDITKGQAITVDENGNSWFPVSNIHPSNEFVSGVNFYFTNLSNLYVAAENILGQSLTGKFYKSGMITANLGTGLDAWAENTGLYLAKRGFSDWEFLTSVPLANNHIITIDPGGFDRQIKGVTGVPNLMSGEFKIENTANANVDADKTRENIVTLLNNLAYTESFAERFYCRATIDGESPRATAIVTAALAAGNLIQIAPGSGMVGTTTILTAVAESATPTIGQFRIGNSTQEAVYNIAHAINETTFFKDDAQTVAGHFCYAEPVGSMIRLTYYKPGFSARNIVMTTNTANITLNQFTGGTCKVRVFRQQLSSSAIPVSSTTPASLSVTAVSADETITQYVLEKRIMSKSRVKGNEHNIRVGTIEEVAGTTVKFKVG